MLKRYLFVLITLMAVLATLLPSCGSKSDDTFRLGVPIPLTGDMSYVGEGIKKTYDLLVEDANAHGGFLGKQIEVFYEDDKGDPKEAALVADRLKAKKPQAVINYFSKVTEAAQPIYEEAGILHIGSLCTSEILTQRGYEKFIRVIYNDDTLSSWLLEYIQQFWADKNIWILHDGTSYPKGIADSFVIKAAEVNIIPHIEQYNAADKDFTPILTKLKGENADVVILFGYYAQQGLFTKQAFDLGTSWQWLLSGDYTLETTNIAGADALQGAKLFMTPNGEDITYPEAQAFRELWKAKYGEMPSDSMWFAAADGFYVLKAAVEGAKSFDAATLANYIKNDMKNFNGVYGPIDDWTETGETIRGGFMIYNFDADGYPKLAPPDEQPK